MIIMIISCLKERKVGTREEKWICRGEGSVARPNN